MTEHETLTELKTHVIWIRTFIEKFPEECEKRYAKKYTEKFVWIAIGGLCALALTQIQQAQAALESIF